MGTDNLHHKRKAWRKTRKENEKEEKSVIFIICEGEKTEINYFKSFQKEHKMTNLHIEKSQYGNTPMNIVQHGKEKYRDTDCDTVYCVFDKDEHADYCKAVTHINNGREPLISITSVPCFEYWFLLHFCETDRPYKKTGKKSAAELLIKDLKKYIPKYKKNAEDMYSILREYMQIAIERAKKIDEQQKKAGTDDPSTKVHLLIEALIK
jgi:hypothetical protein